MTATPDDNNARGAEKQVISLLGLTKFDYGYPPRGTSTPSVDETRTLGNDEAVLVFL